MAASSIDVQTELYIVAGILGGACLLLTIAAIYNSVTIISLQTKVAVLQAAGTAAVKAVSDAVERSPTPMAGDPYEQRHAREDPYRRQDSRNSYNMDRQPPSRPHQDDRRPPAGYY